MSGLPDRELASPAAQGSGLARLRHGLALEFARPAGRGAIAFGIPSLDAALGGGLAAGALHEIAAAREAEIPAATGFALLLAVRCRGPFVWVAEDMALAESGAPYGPGLADLGIAPERMIAVAAAKSRDVLWAMEEALAGASTATVLGEVRSGVDLTATRRLSLAAGRGRALALLLRSTPPTDASAAATRFVVGAAPSGTAGVPGAPSAAPQSMAFGFGPSPPRFCVRLVRNRRGPLGEWMLEYDRVEQRFNAPADREPVAETALDRPRQAASA